MAHKVTAGNKAWPGPVPGMKCKSFQLEQEFINDFQNT